MTVLTHLGESPTQPRTADDTSNSTAARQLLDRLAYAVASTVRLKAAPCWALLCSMLATAALPMTLLLIAYWIR